MSKLFWNALKLSPLLLVATLLLGTRTQAAEVPEAELAPKSAAGTSLPNRSLEQINQYTQAPTTSIAQVTSVSQLSDVQPTDWAFQSLQSLVERYGCIAGYPDGTYRGNRALTRYEFAAGLNACLDRVNELIAAASSESVTREDLATLQRLQEEFSAELATLRGRVDSLEAQTAEIEANQFSTTTKLTGEVVVAVSDVFGDQLAVTPGELRQTSPTTATNQLEAAQEGDLDINTTLSDRARLNFDTSFFGTDLLRTRVQARNIAPFTRTNNLGAGGDTGTFMTRLGFDGGASGALGDNDVALDDFFYRFQVGNAATVKLDFAQAEYNDNVFTFNPAFESSGRGAISRFGRFNPIYRQGSDGTGLTVNLLPDGPISVSLGYLAPTGNNPGEDFGLFNGTYAALGQVALRPIEALSVGLTYVHSYDTPARRLSALTNQAQRNVSVSGLTGGVFANQPFGNIATSANHYGAEASFRLTSKVTISGWYGLTYAIAEDGTAAGVTQGDTARMSNWAASLALQDFGREGSVLGVIFGQPPKVNGNDFGGEGSAARTDNDTSYHLEALYRYPLTDNIEITPGVAVIFNPEHNSDNDDIYVGTIRTTFRF